MAQGRNQLPMLHVATVHFQSPRWISIQLRELRRHLNDPFRIWASLEGIDPSLGACFDRAIEEEGEHGDKLNGLAREIASEARDDDLIMFLDGDAFPIADPKPLIERGLAAAPLLAVRRAENNDERFPHPCFCVTSVGAWRDLSGDWREVGEELLRRLERGRTPWTEVLRSNRHDLHPVFYAVYGDAVYHHGAGFRSPVSLVDVAAAGAGPDDWRKFRREEMEGIVRRNRRQSERVFARIARDDPDWLSDVAGLKAPAGRSRR